jgi:hypothetical protein
MLAFLMILTLVGQTSASTMVSCDMMDMSTMQMPNTDNDDESMSHDMHQMMIADEAQSTTATNCCLDSCDCVTMSCNPSSFTSDLLALSIVPIIAELELKNIALPENQFLSYLFKPPIV